jgi:hypothetical protein
MSALKDNNFLKEIVNLLQSAKQQVVRSVNQTMVITYFEIGRMIVEEQQQGKDRAEYGKSLLKELSNGLTKEFGKGFSVKNLERMRAFYQIYGKSSTLLSKSQKQQTLSANSNSVVIKQQALSADFELSWSHYLTLMRIDDESERKFYEIEQ